MTRNKFFLILIIATILDLTAYVCLVRYEVNRLDKQFKTMEDSLESNMVRVAERIIERAEQKLKQK